ncbi:MAG: hypothetical protein ACHQUA_00570 [Microgenomates group bacterium]
MNPVSETPAQLPVTQPQSPVTATANQVPKQTKLNPFLLILIGLVFGFAGGLFLGKQIYSSSQATAIYTSPTPTQNSETQETEMYQGKYFSISKSTKWKFVSDINQSPATPEVLETVSFTNGKANLNIQVGTNLVEKVLEYQDGDVDGKVILSGVSFTKKAGYGGLAGSVYSVTLVGNSNGNTYLISYYTQDIQNIESYSKDFDEILSTFELKK